MPSLNIVEGATTLQPLSPSIDRYGSWPPMFKYFIRHETNTRKERTMAAHFQIAFGQGRLVRMLGSWGGKNGINIMNMEHGMTMIQSDITI